MRDQSEKHCHKAPKKRGGSKILLLAALVMVALTVVLTAACGRANAEAPVYTPAQSEAPASPAPEETATLPVQAMERRMDEPEAALTIGEDWLDDAIFVGDSLTGALFNYNLVYGGLGDASVVFSNGFACHNGAENDYRLAFKGQMMGIGEAVSEAGANKVFLLFAMNDLGQPIDELKESWVGLIEHIRSYSQADIYIQSGTPVFTETGNFTNENVSQLNAMLRELCTERDCVYVDIASGLTDENGLLKKEYSVDFVHFNNDGCKRWVEALYDPEVYLTNEQEDVK